MDHVAADVHRQISTDRAGFSFQGLGGSDQLAGAGNHAIPFPHHRHHGATGDELHQAGKEGTLAVHAVVAFGQLPAGGQLLEAHELEALALKTAEDFSHQTALNTVGLDGNKRAFSSHEEKATNNSSRPSSAAALPVGKHSRRLSGQASLDLRFF